MTSVTLAQNNPTIPQKKLRIWFGVLFIFGLFHVLGLLFQVGGQSFETIRGDLLNIPPSVIAGCIGYLVSKHQQGSMKRFWIWLSISSFLLGLGDGVWAYCELVLKIDPFPSVADVFYILHSVTIIVAFLMIPRDQVKNPSSRHKIWS